MFLAKASIKRPIAMSTLILCLSMFGILAYRTVGVDTLPRADIPYITVSVIYAGASPDEIETSVARKIEDAVAQVDGIKHISTTCLNNFCQVLLEFELNRDVDDCATDVRDRISLIRNDLPKAIEEPQTLKYDVNATAVVTLALTGDLSIDELYDYADDKLSSKFSSLGGVAKVDLIGGMKREVLVNVDRDKLASRGLTMAQIVQKLGTENQKIPVGQIDDGKREVALMFDAEADQIKDLGEIQVGVVQGQRVYLRDVATFSFGTERYKSKAFIDGKPCVLMKITKKGEANAVEVVNRVKKVFDSLQGSLPGGMKLGWFRDDGEFVNAQVRDGISSIWQGILLTGIVLILFLADVRTAFVAFVSIPVTMIISMVTFSWFDYTLNLITLSALGISIGILVTNSIVVLESVSDALGKKDADKDVRTTVERATSAVGLAVAASALTNIAVFLPIANMHSVSGKFLAPFGVTTAVATFASLLISFTLTPILAVQCHNWGKTSNKVLSFLLKPWNLFYAATQRGYLASLRLTLKLPLLFVLVVAVVSFFALKFLASNTQMEFIHQMDMNDLTVRLEFPADYNLDHTVARANAVAARLAKDPAVAHTTVSCGKIQGLIGQVSEGSYLAEITFRLTTKTLREKQPGNSIAEISARFRRQVNDEPDCIPAVLVPSVVGSGQDIQMMISGDDLDKLNSIGLQSAKEIESDPTSAEVTHSIRPGRPEVRFQPNRAVLHDLDIPSYLVGTSLRASFAGIKQSTYKHGDRSYDIRVRYTQEPGSEQIPALNLPGPDGKPMTVGSVTKLVDRMQPTQIIRYDKQRTVVIYANAGKGYGLDTAMSHQQKIIKSHMPAGYRLFFSGMAEKMGETVAEFTTVMVVAILLTYLLLAAILESWGQPFIIMLTVPFSYLGLYMALYFTGSTMTTFGLLSGIMLIGVVVNAAILLIDDTNTVRKTTSLSKKDALVQAANREFRPILMSCVAALFGMLPMAFSSGFGSELRQDIGMASVGGIIVSSLLSLYFIPAFYVVAAGRDKKTPAA